MFFFFLSFIFAVVASGGGGGGRARELGGPMVQICSVCLARGRFFSSGNVWVVAPQSGVQSGRLGVSQEARSSPRAVVTKSTFTHRVVVVYGAWSPYRLLPVGGARQVKPAASLTPKIWPVWAFPFDSVGSGFVQLDPLHHPVVFYLFCLFVHW